MLNGYRIGEYPATPLKGNPMYLPPPGFIEVTKENQDTKVSPHFTLKQFLCKEDTTKSFPKYVLFKERLPLKLEAVLERVNAMGFAVDTLHVMSAFRTPFYNHAIGDVKYSMHQWGSAADIYIDPLKKDRMADLNRDGQVDIQDSKFLYDEIERMLASKELARFQGGMGFYPANVRAPAVRPRRRPRHRRPLERARACAWCPRRARRAPIPCWRTRRTFALRWPFSPRWRPGPALLSPPPPSFRCRTRGC